LKRLVKNTVRFALASEKRKRPVRREDLKRRTAGLTVCCKFILIIRFHEVVNDRSKLIPCVLAEAQKELRDVFGMELAELPVRKKKSTSVASRRGA
jgi:hypothetical protein